MHAKLQSQLIALGRLVAVEAAADLERIAELANAAVDPTADLVAKRGAALAEAYVGAMAPFREAIIQSTSAEDAIARVSALYGEWSPRRVTEMVDEALQLAAAQGAVEAKSRA